MGKNKRKQIPCFDAFHNVELQCDSVEECDMVCWLAEAASLSIIQDYEYQPESIQLFDAASYIDVNGKKRSLLRDHVYSADFLIKFQPSLCLPLCKELKVPFEALPYKSFQSYVDVKGTYQKADGGRTFSLNQKWVYQTARIYVSKIVPKEFFAVCGCPESCRLTKKTKQVRKGFDAFPSISQVFINKNASLK